MCEGLLSGAVQLTSADTPRKAPRLPVILVDDCFEILACMGERKDVSNHLVCVQELGPIDILDDKLEAFGWHVQQTFGVNSTILLSHDQQSADLRLVAR